MALYVPLPTGATPELSYAAQVASLLPGLNLGQPGGGSSWYTTFADGLSRSVAWLASGGTASTSLGLARGGGLTFQSSVTVNGVAGVMTGNSTVGFVTMTTNTRTDQWAMAARLKIPATTANTRAFFGFQETSHSSHNGLALVGTGVNTGTLSLDASGTLVATSWVLDTTAFHEFLVTFDGTTMTGYVDGVQVGAAANSASINTSPNGAGFYVTNNGVGTNEQLIASRYFAAVGAS